MKQTKESRFNGKFEYVFVVEAQGCSDKFSPAKLKNKLRKETLRELKGYIGYSSLSVR